MTTKAKIWDYRFLELARQVSTWSKDPSTQVGAVIVDQQRRVLSLGYNGFPRGVEDSPKLYLHKPSKYKMIVHAEANAILNATQSLEGATLYSTLFTCCECAKLVIQSGIKRVVSYQHLHSEKQHWEESFAVAREMYLQAGVQVYGSPL
jgi:dCMP deaminase